MSDHVYSEINTQLDPTPRKIKMAQAETQKPAMQKLTTEKPVIDNPPPSADLHQKLNNTIQAVETGSKSALNYVMANSDIIGGLILAALAIAILGYRFTA